MNMNIYKLLFPDNFTRGYIQIGIALALMVCLCMTSYNSIDNKVSEVPISGEISDIKVSTTSGGAGKYSGGAVIYHILLKNHKIIFMLDDTSVFTNWQFD